MLLMSVTLPKTGMQTYVSEKVLYKTKIKVPCCPSKLITDQYTAPQSLHSIKRYPTKAMKTDRLPLLGSKLSPLGSALYLLVCRIY